jgi:hypothetical protein
VYNEGARSERNNMNKYEIYELIQKNKGKIFTVKFVKKNGDERTMNCRLGVSKGITGKGMSFDSLSRDLLPVWDMQSEGYRMINLSTILEIKIAGKVYTA